MHITSCNFLLVIKFDVNYHSSSTSISNTFKLFYDSNFCLNCPVFSALSFCRSLSPLAPANKRRICSYNYKCCFYCLTITFAAKQDSNDLYMSCYSHFQSN